MLDPATVLIYRFVYFSLINFIIVVFNIKQILFTKLRTYNMNMCNYCTSLIMLLIFINVVWKSNNYKLWKRAVTQRFDVVIRVEIVDGFPKTKQRSAVIRVWLTKPKTHLLLCLLRHSCISMLTADCERGVQANLLKTQYSLCAYLLYIYIYV